MTFSIFARTTSVASASSESFASRRIRFSPPRGADVFSSSKRAAADAWVFANQKRMKDARRRRRSGLAKKSTTTTTTTTTTMERRVKVEEKADEGDDDVFATRRERNACSSSSSRVSVSSCNRRSFFLQSTSTLAVLASLTVSSSGATTAEKAFASSSSDLATTLPKDYTEKLRLAGELLIKSVEFERDHPSASVSERFAAADPAKQAVKDYIQTWQGRAETRDLETSAITGEVLRELARYYKKNGSQVALDVDLRDDVISKLTEVLNMLPAKAPTLAERVLGISNAAEKTKSKDN
jgi:hypothetical protein